MADTRADVVIVGAGPTGLALAAELKRLGTQALLVEKESFGQNTSRATVVHARTLEMLEALGVSQQLIDRGLILHTARLHEGDTVRAHISFDGLDTAYSYMLVCTQDQTENVLTRRLRELGGAEIRAIEVTEIKPDDDGVTATYVAGGVLIQDVRAQWLVGCDGMHSTVRQAAGIGFEGGNYDENFVLADVEMPRLDGFGLLGAIRAETRFARLPVVLMTSRGDAADVARGLDLGADAYLTKQKFDQRQLLDTIGQLL